MTDENDFFLTDEWIKEGSESEEECESFSVGGYLHEVNSQTKQFRVEKDMEGSETPFIWLDENGKNPIEMDTHSVMDFLEGYEIYRDGIDELIQYWQKEQENVEKGLGDSLDRTIGTFLEQLQSLRKK